MYFTGEGVVPHDVKDIFDEQNIPVVRIYPINNYLCCLVRVAAEVNFHSISLPCDSSRWKIHCVALYFNKGR